MADNPPGPPGPEDHYRFQDDPPRPAAGGSAPKPKPPRPPDRARRPRLARPPRQDPGAAGAAKPPFGGLFSWPKKPQPMTPTQWIIFGGMLALFVGVAGGMAIWQN